ncbi:Hypothetical protein, putative [Bodo saltans]|uniref:BTB domain-containing protein n=1 Tax=Bodo saltans TaxID=75058 RepID=A0A0S4KK95_BODSA|nr:Hypothetical protein, putative [Bodo saltans]|eukprot:CUI14862.1 Hypothetical protein, putative [Bodo saltans]
MKTAASPEGSSGGGGSATRQALANFSTYSSVPVSDHTFPTARGLFSSSLFKEGPRIQGKLAPLASQVGGEGGQQVAPLWSQYKTTLSGVAPSLNTAGMKESAADFLQQQQQSPQQQQPTHDAIAAAAAGEHVVNFLPVMHARYLNDCGGITPITPRARWGHTMSAIGDAVYVFGGTVVPGGDASNDLFTFSPKTNDWEPCLSVNRGLAPAPRYQHAAAVVDGGRYLVIYGGRGNHGTVAYGDMLAYDTVTLEWSVWYSPTAALASPTPAGGATEGGSKHEPSTIYGHSMVVSKQRLYVFGGRVGRAGGGGGDALSNDVYIFHWPSRTWKKRVHVAAPKKTGVEKDDELAAASYAAAVPHKRLHHAACVLGDDESGWMVIHGGEQQSASSVEGLADTWGFHLLSRRWVLIHGGWTGDSAPRSRHVLMSSGEAILAVGGCTRVSTSALAQRVDSFLSVLPIFASRGTASSADEANLQTTGTWSPVILGNSSCAPPSLRSFGAAMLDGFLYAFGGVPSDTVPANNHLIRCLAADGVPIRDEMLSGLMRGLVLRAAAAPQHGGKSSGGPSDSPPRHNRGSAADDSSSATEAFSYSWHCDLALAVGDHQKLYVHRALVAQRAPEFFNDLLTCRIEDGVDHGSQQQLALGTFTAVHRVAFDPPCITTDGNSRVKGLRVHMNASQLTAFLTWVYTGSVDPTTVGEHASVLRSAAAEYKLPSLFSDVESAVLSGQQEDSNINNKLPPARAPTTATTLSLTNDMLKQLGTPSSCNATILFVDPYTGQELAHPAHTWVLANACGVFAQLLRPLWTTIDGIRMQDVNTVDGITAKIAAGKRTTQIGGGGGGGSQRRAVVIGPVKIPLLSVKPILEYLYTCGGGGATLSASISREAALQVLMGATTLHLTTLQRYCESVVAREEVNFASCCDFVTLAKSYRAQLLEEMSLITAAVGYEEEVKRSAGFANLGPSDQQVIEKIAAEIGGTWAAAAAGKTEQKSAEEYAARFGNSRQL